MVNLITNRTQADVDRVKELAARGWNDMTAAERSEWLGVDDRGNEIETPCTRGAYNYRDLNRLGAAVNEIGEKMGISSNVKTNWTATDAPRSAELAQLLGSIKEFRARIPDISAVPLPDSLTNLTWQVANSIEQFLLDAYRATENSPLTVTHDGAGNVTIAKNGLTVSYDTDGNVTLFGVEATCTDGNVTII